jgi:hypothetical protein
MFQKLNIILNFVALLTLLLVEIGAIAQENKEVEQFQESILKQINPNNKITNTKYSDTHQESSKTLTKDTTVTPAPITPSNTSSSQQNNHYFIKDNTNGHLTNKERLELERLDRVNTLEKSVGITRHLNKFPTFFPRVDPPK